MKIYTTSLTKGRLRQQPKKKLNYGFFLGQTRKFLLVYKDIQRERERDGNIIFHMFTTRIV